MSKTEDLQLNKDLIEAARFMQENEARYLVDLYYMVQEHRKAANNQHKASVKAGEPAHLVGWAAATQEYVESQIKRALDKYTDSHEVSRWAKSILGCGPVLSAGLMAHINIEKAPTVGHIFSYAGIVPGQKRRKGEKINWNPQLKRLQWLCGECFVKVSGKENSTYGCLFKERKAYEQEMNESGGYEEQAQEALVNYNYGRDTEAFAWYSNGKLPPAHVHARAKRWTVKMFLSHYHEAAFVSRFGKLPPEPYAISQLGHAHQVYAPNMDLVDRWTQLHRSNRADAG